MNSKHNWPALFSVGLLAVITFNASTRLAANEETTEPGGEGPKPLTVLPKIPGSIMAHQIVKWDTVVKRGTTVAKVNIKLSDESLVYITGDTMLSFSDKGPGQLRLQKF